MKDMEWSGRNQIIIMQSFPLMSYCLMSNRVPPAGGGRET